MEDSLFYFLTLAVSISLAVLLSSRISHRCKGPPLPPGPRTPLISLRRSSFELESFLHGLFQKYGSIICVKLTTRPAIFISDRTWAHRALIQHGATFADRPTYNPASQVITSGQRNIASAKYGPIWRALRRNLTAEILHPSRVRMYAPARKWMFSILIDQLNAQMKRDGSVAAMENFQFAMFCLLVLMCFGERFDEVKIRQIEEVQRELMNYFIKLQVFIFITRGNNLCPCVVLGIGPQPIRICCHWTVQVA
jgi:cytochrome P450 family 89 subfamily A